MSKLERKDTSLIVLEKQMVLDNLFDKANNFTEVSTVDCCVRLLEILAVCLWVLWGDPNIISSHCLCPRVWVASTINNLAERSQESFLLLCCLLLTFWHVIPHVRI